MHRAAFVFYSSCLAETTSSLPIFEATARSGGSQLMSGICGNAFGQLPHQYLANEQASERDRIDRQLRTRERRMDAFIRARFQRIRSTHSAREGPGSNGSPKYWVSRATFPSLN